MSRSPELTEERDYNQNITCPCDNCINGMINNLCVKMKREQSGQPGRLEGSTEEILKPDLKGYREMSSDISRGNSTDVIDTYWCITDYPQLSALKQ